MRGTWKVGLAFVAALAAPVSGGAQLITFDPFPSIPAGVTVEYFDGGLTGFLAAMPVPNGVPLAANPSAIPGGGDALRLVDGAFGPFGALFTFASPISFFSAVGNDFGGDPFSDNEIVFLTAFDALGMVIGTASTSSPYAVPNLKPVSVAAAGITAVAFTYTTDVGFYSVDDVEYSALATVPEPTTVALMAGGLLALGAFARRRRTA